MRVPVGNQQSTSIINAPDRVVGLVMMNVTGVDVWVSDDQRQLDTVDDANLPTVGFLLPANQVLPTVISPFQGQLFARAQNQAQVEVISFTINYPKC